MKKYQPPTEPDQANEIIPILELTDNFIRTKYITVDLNSRTVRIARREIDFTMAEFRLFCLFVQNINKTLLYDQIEKALWKAGSYSSRCAIQKQVERIRKIIEPANSKVDIVTRSGWGYKMVEFGLSPY